MKLWPPALPVSLLTRLGLFFALVALVTFSCVGSYLYRCLSAELALRDDQDLIGKISLMRHIIEESPSADAIEKDPRLFLEAIASHDRMMVVVKKMDGKVLLHSNPELGDLSAAQVVPLQRSPDRYAIHSITTSSNVVTRSVAAQERITRTGEQIEIIVARTTSDRMLLLKNYQAEVWTAAILGTLFSTVFGYLLVRQGLRPVRTLASQAHSITAHRLETRLDVQTAPQELQEMVAAFNAMLDRLHDSFQRLSQFSADLAHDLRTPLNNLMVQTQVALSQPRSADDYQNLLSSNTEEYERLARMVESMLFLARAEHAHGSLKKGPLNAQQELQRIADYFEGVSEDANVKIVVEAQDTVYADPILLRRAVNNLTANAIRYTSAGDTIYLRAQLQDNMTVISVSNPGEKIDEQHLSRLFDRFYRGDAARSNAGSSSGLGLAIVRSIMHLHSGRADVKSTSYRNRALTVFSLYFPDGS